MNRHIRNVKNELNSMSRPVPPKKSSSKTIVSRIYLSFCMVSSHHYTLFSSKNHAQLRSKNRNFEFNFLTKPDAFLSRIK